MQQNKHGVVKLFSQFGHFSLVLIIGFSTLNANDTKSFANFKRAQQKSFQNYQDKRDNDFNSYLKQQFKAYKVYVSKPLYEQPKPSKIEPTKELHVEPVGPRISIKIKEDTKKAKLVEKKKIKKEIISIVKEEKKLIAIVTPIQSIPKDINFEFYGSNLGFDMPEGIKKANFYPQNQKGISTFFDSAASSDYENLITDIKKISKDMNLNDWGVYLLVLKISNKIFSEEDDSKLMSWFIFNKLGYAVKVGLANKHIVLMHYSKKTIYSTPNYSFDTKKYYVIANYSKGRVGRLFSYEQDYPGAIKDIDLSLKTLPNFVSNMKKKSLEFKQFGHTYTVPFTYNKNLIDFMSTYPQADYDVFFNAPLADKTYKDIASGLKKYLDGKKASDAMNFVLNFVQKSFKYERDNQQFGREKVMFAEETLYFDKSDCEDRAILFSYLIKELFHVPVIGVKYSDHMATALYIPIKGDKVIVNNRKFVIADPTFINANIGMSMPKYRSKKPQSYIVVKRD